MKTRKARTMAGTGLLSGLVWAENVGWINFNPKVPDHPGHYGVTIDHQGNFDGWAWGENIGWVHFQAKTPFLYKVQTSWSTRCVVDLPDLAGFCELWLETGSQLKAALDSSNEVDFEDYCTLADLWLERCPIGWPLEN